MSLRSELDRLERAVLPDKRPVSRRDAVALLRGLTEAAAPLVPRERRREYNAAMRGAADVLRGPLPPTAAALARAVGDLARTVEPLLGGDPGRWRESVAAVLEYLS